MWLASSRCTDRARTERNQPGAAGATRINFCGGAVRQEITARVRHIGAAIAGRFCRKLVRMRWQFSNSKGMRFLASPLAKRKTAARVYGGAATQIWQGKVNLPITAKSSTKQGKQCLVLVNREELSVALGPALRRKGEAHHPDFGQKRFSHK